MVGQGPTLPDRTAKRREPRISLRIFPLSACVTLIILLLASAGTLHAASPSYSFGVTPQFDQRRLVATWQPIIDELTRRTGLTFTLASVPQEAGFEKRFLAGEYDFAYMNPYHAVLATQRQGYQTLVRDHAEFLYGVLVVRRASPIHAPRDLDGKTVAFPSPNSLGASLLIRADLANTFHVRITPRYVQTHTSVYLQVAQGMVDAGGGVQGTLDSQPQAVRDRLRVIHTTVKVPPHPLMAHPRVPLAVQNKVRQAFLDMGATAAGQALLAAVPIRRIGPASAWDYVVLEQFGLKAFYVEGNVP
jgi:phosphonate transport system substrate-binding protein